MHKPSVVIIDNYDSFTFNLAHLVRELHADCTVVRNDQFQLQELRDFDRIILSPGPGIPSEAGLLLDVIRTYAGQKPILGVCLGHQAIGEVFGGKLTNLSDVFHGVQTEVTVTRPDYIFSRISQPPLADGTAGHMLVGRYHSWVVDAATLPDTLEATAVSAEGQIMALRHRQLDIRGIQFHPESVLTPEGSKLIQAWLEHDA